MPAVLIKGTLSARTWLEYGLLLVFSLHALTPYFISTRAPVSLVAPLVLLLFLAVVIEQYRSSKTARLVSNERLYLLLFLVANAVSMFNSRNLPHSLVKLKSFLGGGILAYVVSQVNPHSFLKRLIPMMCFILFLASILGVVQFVIGWGYPALIFVAKKHNLYYATGFATTHTEFGGHIITFLPAIFALRLMTSTPDEGSSWAKLNEAALFSSTVALVLTFSRSAWLGVGVALSLFIALAGKKRREAIGMGVVVFAIAMGSFFIVKQIYPNLTSERLSVDPSAWSRIEYLILGWEMFKEHPLIGTGPDSFVDNFEEVKARVLPDSFVQNLGPHNTFISIVVGSGVLGLSVFLLLVVSALRNILMAFCSEVPLARKLLFLSLASSLVGFSIHMAFHDLFGEKFFWMLLGLGFGSKNMVSEGEGGDLSSDR